MLYEVRPRLNNILAARDMTQRELSRRTGIPQGTISRFDKNERHAAAHLFKISRALNVNIEDLFEVVEAKPEEVIENSLNLIEE